MKQFIVLMAVALAASAQATSIVNEPSVLNVERHMLGSGNPAENGNDLEMAVPVLSNNIFHAPQYLPYYPTAATIWPRVVEVECKLSKTGRSCEGYDWSPSMGRAEYLFVRPVMKAPPPPPQVIEIPGPERIILKEVPVKKKRE